MLFLLHFSLGSFAPTICLHAVPEHLVPRSMLEWGQHPKTLEIIVSEDFAQVDDEESTIIFDRTCLTVLPEIGCGIDNLEVQTSTEPEWTVIGRNEYCIGLLRTANQAATVVETVFPSETEESHRVRVAIGLSSDTDETTAISTLSLSLERKFDDHSSSGSRADGGGLDAASVYKWMGETLAKTGSKRLGEIPESSDTPTDGRIELPLDVYVQYGKSAEIKYVSVCRNDSGSGARYEWGSAGNRPSCTLLTSTGHVPP